MRPNRACAIISSEDGFDDPQVAHVVCDKNIGTHRLSGGQLRRVGIGIELVALPTVSARCCLSVTRDIGLESVDLTVPFACSQCE